MTIDLRSRTASTLGSLRDDALYRGSLVLLANTVALSSFGFAFWALAARSYPAADVGTLSGMAAGISLLATVAALGLPNIVTRNAASTPDVPGLVTGAAAAIVSVGAGACLFTVLVIGPHLPAVLHLRPGAGMGLLVTALVVCTAVSGTLDACLIATRASHAVLIKNLAGSIVKVGALLLFSALGSAGLLLAYSLGVVCAAMFSGVALASRLRRTQVGGAARACRAHPRTGRLRRHLPMTGGNYLATLMGILPTTVVPLEVLAQRGPTETARFAAAFMVAGFLNSLPSIVAQVLFAEASRHRGPLSGQLRKAIGGVYALVVPALIVLLLAAPLVLRVFGPAYAAASTGCLRVLALSALLTCGTYLVDSALLARDRMAAYLVMNGTNAALVLGCVGVLLPHGLTAAAWGWLLAQGLSLLLGLLLLARRQGSALATA